MNEQHNKRFFLERLVVQKFRSLYNVSLDPGRINIFVGPNNSGKSNLFALFRFLHDMTSDPNADQQYRQKARRLIWCGTNGEEESDRFHAVFYLRYSGRRVFCYEITVDSNLVFVKEVLREIRRGSREILVNRSGEQLEFQTAHGETRIVSVSPHRLALSILSEAPYSEERTPETKEVTEFIRGWRVVDADPQAIKKSLSSPIYPDHTSDKIPPLEPNGRNIAEFLYALERCSPDDFDLVQERLRASSLFTNEIRAVSTETPSGTAVTYRFQESLSTLSASHLPEDESDSTARVLALLALLLADKSHSLVCIEEPDRDLHPKLMIHIADAIRYFETLKEPYSQIFVTTHHPLFLNCFDIREESEYLKVFVAERSEETGKTEFRYLNPERFGWWLGKYSLGELFARRITDVIGKGAS